MKQARTIADVLTLEGKTHIAHQGDAGIDVFYTGDKPIDLAPLERAPLDTGVVARFDSNNHFILVCPRSGLAFNKGITVLNAPGVIDSGFTGSIAVCLVNLSNSSYTINPGDKIAQLVIAENITGQLAEGGELRGDHGFGSSGV